MLSLYCKSTQQEEMSFLLAMFTLIYLLNTFWQPRILCQNIVSLRPWSASTEGQQSCEGSGAQVLLGAAKETGFVQSGEEEARSEPYRSLQCPERRLWWGGSRPLLLGNSNRMRGDGLKLSKGRFSLNIRKILFLERVVMQWHRLPMEWWGHHPWRCLRAVWMWHWWTRLVSMVWWAGG